MRDLSRKVEADTARAAARSAKLDAGTGAAGLEDEIDEEVERTQMQIANREKQMAMQRAKKNKETKAR